jgi:hypothetical protein
LIDDLLAPDVDQIDEQCQVRGRHQRPARPAPPRPSQHQADEGIDRGPHHHVLEQAGEHLEPAHHPLHVKLAGAEQPELSTPPAAAHITSQTGRALARRTPTAAPGRAFRVTPNQVSLVGVIRQSDRSPTGVIPWGQPRRAETWRGAEKRLLPRAASVAGADNWFEVLHSRVPK